MKAHRERAFYLFSEAAADCMLPEEPVTFYQIDKNAVEPSPDGWKNWTPYYSYAEFDEKRNQFGTSAVSW